MPTSAPSEAPSCWDSVPALACLSTRLPCAVLSLRTAGRQRLVRAQGVPPADVQLPWAAVDAVQTTGAPLVVPDLATSGFAAEPFVQQHPELPFFAGVPLLSPPGQTHGVLYVMGPSPAALTDVLEALDLVARHVAEVCRLQSQADQVSRILPLACHELNTPLNGILGLATVMEAPEAEVIAKSAEHAMGAVQQLKDFLEGIQRTLQLETAPFSLHACIAEAAASVHPVPPQVRLLADHSCDLEVHGDRQRVRQVLETLLENAVKFTPQGQVTVRVAPSESPGLLHLEVNDTGAGMSPTHARRLFQRDAVPDAAFRRCGAPGFGLVVAQALCAAMGGRMWVVSAVGRGSTFHFTIRAETRSTPRDPSRPRPVLTSLLQYASEEEDEAYTREEGTPQSTCSALSSHSGEGFTSPAGFPPPLPSAATEEATPDSGAAGDGRPDTPLGRAAAAPSAAFGPAEVRVLVVDDNRINQRVLLEFLHRLQVQADVVDDGAQAVVACAQRSYQLVLMDVEMPVMDGVEATGRLRRAAEAAGRACPCVVGVSANTLDANRSKCLAAGMELFLPKPVRFPLVREVVEWARARVSPAPRRLSLPTPPSPLPPSDAGRCDAASASDLDFTLSLGPGSSKRPRARFTLPPLEALLLDAIVLPSDVPAAPGSASALPWTQHQVSPPAGPAPCRRSPVGRIRACSEPMGYQPQAPKGSRLPRFLRPQLSDRASM